MNRVIKPHRLVAALMLLAGCSTTQPEEEPAAVVRNVPPDQYAAAVDQTVACINASGATAWATQEDSGLFSINVTPADAQTDRTMDAFVSGCQETHLDRIELAYQETTLGMPTKEEAQAIEVRCAIEHGLIAPGSTYEDVSDYYDSTGDQPPPMPYWNCVSEG